MATAHTWRSIYAVCNETVILKGERATVEISAADPLSAVLLLAHYGADEIERIHRGETFRVPAGALRDTLARLAREQPEEAQP